MAVSKTKTAEAAVETTENAQVTTEAAEKVYNFTSKKKFLTVSALKVQFINGKASTKSLEVAKALAKIDGVELVEE